MNADFLRVIAAAPEERRGLFLKTVERLGTPLVTSATLQDVPSDENLQNRWNIA